PLLQVLCAQLYRMALGRPDRVVRAADLADAVRQVSPGRAGGLRGSAHDLGAYVRHLAAQAFGGRSPRDHSAVVRVMQDLQLRPPDGGVTRDLVLDRQLAQRWRGGTPFEAMLQAAAAPEVHLLEESWLNVGGVEGRYVSLGHEALAPALARQA